MIKLGDDSLGLIDLLTKLKTLESFKRVTSSRSIISSYKYRLLIVTYAGTSNYKFELIGFQIV